MSRNLGALPSQMILLLMSRGYIQYADVKNVQPSSLDLSLSDEIWRLPGVALPQRNESVRALIKRCGARRYDISQPLEAGVTYLVRLREFLRLPREIYAFANPKSSTGRIDLHCRVVADGVLRFDSIPREYQGEAWLMVKSNSFLVRLHEGVALSQIRFFNADRRLSVRELKVAIDHDGLLFSPSGKKYQDTNIKITDLDGSAILTLDLRCEPMGWVAHSPKNPQAVLDLSKPGGHRAEDFFHLIEPNPDGSVFFVPGAFYILSSKESVRVPPMFACEMRTMDDRSGEFRAHYAGFIDPGWGWGEKGEGKGRPLTLEVRPHEKLIVTHGQPIAKIGFEIMADIPKVLYDAGSSNYTHQTAGPLLGKWFV